MSESLKRRVLLVYVKKIKDELEPQWIEICALKRRVDEMHATKRYDRAVVMDLYHALEREETRANDRQ